MPVKKFCNHNATGVMKHLKKDFCEEGLKMVSLKEAYNVKQCVKVRSVQYKTSLAELIIHWGPVTERAELRR